MTLQLKHNVLLSLPNSLFLFLFSFSFCSFSLYQAVITQNLPVVTFSRIPDTPNHHGSYSGPLPETLNPKTKGCLRRRASAQMSSCGSCLGGFGVRSIKGFYKGLLSGFKGTGSCRVVVRYCPQTVTVLIYPYYESKVCGLGFIDVSDPETLDYNWDMTSFLSGCRAKALKKQCVAAGP